MALNADQAGFAVCIVRISDANHFETAGTTSFYTSSVQVGKREQGTRAELVLIKKPVWNFRHFFNNLLRFLQSPVHFISRGVSLRCVAFAPPSSPLLNQAPRFCSLHPEHHSQCHRIKNIHAGIFACPKFAFRRQTRCQFIWKLRR